MSRIICTGWGVPSESCSVVRYEGRSVSTLSSDSSGSPVSGPGQAPASSVGRSWPSGSLRLAPWPKFRSAGPSGWSGAAASASSSRAAAATGCDRSAATRPAQIAASACACGSPPARAASRAGGRRRLGGRVVALQLLDRDRAAEGGDHGLGCHVSPSGA